MSTKLPNDICKAYCDIKTKMVFENNSISELLIYRKIEVSLKVQR